MRRSLMWSSLTSELEVEGIRPSHLTDGRTNRVEGRGDGADDSQMPLMSGVEVAREVREMGNPIFIVGCTGNALREDQVGVARFPHCDYNIG